MTTRRSGVDDAYDKMQESAQREREKSFSAQRGYNVLAEKAKHATLAARNCSIDAKTENQHAACAHLHMEAFQAHDAAQSYAYNNSTIGYAAQQQHKIWRDAHRGPYAKHVKLAGSLSVGLPKMRRW